MDRRRLLRQAKICPPHHDIGLVVIGVLFHKLRLSYPYGRDKDKTLSGDYDMDKSRKNNLRDNSGGSHE